MGECAMYCVIVQLMSRRMVPLMRCLTFSLTGILAGNLNLKFVRYMNIRVCICASTGYEGDF